MKKILRILKKNYKKNIALLVTIIIGIIYLSINELTVFGIVLLSFALLGLAIRTILDIRRVNNDV